jgi:hypothetical protein
LTQKEIITQSCALSFLNFQNGRQYFGGHFVIKMAAIANQNGGHMVQHVLLPVNIHFH